MKKINLLVIAPYKGLDEIISDIIVRKEDVSATYFVANLEEVREILEKINVHDYDAIISRGGTATLLDSLVSLPVYDVGLSGLDALRALSLAKNFNQKTAIIGFEPITKIMYNLCEILGWQYPIITITSEDEAEAHLKQLLAEGVGVVVCDKISSIIAPTLGMNAVMVTSGYETVESSLNQAIRITQSYLRSRTNLSHLTMAFENSPYHCTILDSKGNIVLSPTNTNDKANIISYIKDHKTSILQEENAEFERPFRGGVLSFVLKQRYLQNEQYTYVYSRFHERAESRKIDAITQRSANFEDRVDMALFNSSHYLTSTQEQIEKYAKSMNPVILSGEDGTGKDQAAYFLYTKSAMQNSIFYQIDCETATSKNWNYLFTHHESPLMHNRHTLYFRHVDQLPYTIYRKLLGVITDTNLAQRNRLIFSFIAADKTNSNTYTKDLTQTISCLTMHMPALRERQDDIPYLCTLYINRMNAKLGKQIIGFDARALKAMKSFGWDGNLYQFQRVVEALMLVTNSSYISYEATMRQLSQESAIWSKDDQKGFQFNLNQTLDDINYDIIRQVLKEENNNHSKTAARLGISRSTLWRSLKSHE